MNFDETVNSIGAQFAQVWSAPIPFFVTVGVAAFVIWRVMEWRYSATIDRLRDGAGQPLASQKSKPKPADELAMKRRTMIDFNRQLALAFGEYSSGETFRQYIETTSSFHDIEPYLSADFLEKLRKPRTAYVADPESPHHPLAQYYLDELRRLEREWGLLK